MMCPDFCRCMYGSRGDAVEHPLDVHVDHAVPFVDFQALKRRVWHEAGVVDEDVDPSESLDRLVDQPLDLLAVDDVRRHGKCLAASALDLVRQSLDALDAPG